MIDSVSYMNVGPHKWRERSFGKIRKIENQINKIENADWRPHKLGATLVHKDLYADLSNQEAHKHNRSVRNVVFNLQEAIIEVNEEIKRLKLIQKDYERVLYNVEVDFKINHQSRQMRHNRPNVEGKDGTDDLLVIEQQQLREMRRHLDATLKILKEHLLNIDICRKDLLDVQQERRRVLDLLCQKSNRGSISHSSSRSSMNNMSRLSSASNSQDWSSWNTDPLSAFTPACKKALQNSRNAIADSQNYRAQINGNLDKLRNYRNKSSQLVNDSFIHKLGETETLKNQLHMARVRARSASNKAQRWYNIAEKTMEFNRGPDNYQDLLVRERLDRPVMKVYQRHPGTQVPEAQELIKVDSKLKNSVCDGNKDIQQLKSIDALLLTDIKTKNKAIDVDRRTLRWRRCKSREMHRR